MKQLGWLPAEFGLGFVLKPSAKRMQDCLQAFGGMPITEDWLPYYLRAIGTSEKLELDELARVLLHMNQRRGFKSNRKASNESTQAKEADGDKDGDEALPANENSVEIVRIVQIMDLKEKTRGKSKFELVLADGRRGEIVRDAKPDWED